MALKIATAFIQFTYDDMEYPDPNTWAWDDLLDVNVQNVDVVEVDVRTAQSFAAIVNTESVDDYFDEHPYESLLWWSNRYGWVPLDSATFFNQTEMDGFFLPQDGAWILL